MACRSNFSRKRPGWRAAGNYQFRIDYAQAKDAPGISAIFDFYSNNSLAKARNNTFTIN